MNAQHAHPLHPLTEEATFPKTVSEAKHAEIRAAVVQDTALIRCWYLAAELPLTILKHTSVSKREVLQ